MKKLFRVLTLGVACVLLASCGGPKEPAKGNDPLVDNTYESFNVFGNNKVVQGEEDIDNDWAVKEFNGMTAISLADAKALNAELGATLETKSINGLYKFEGLVLGTKDAGWKANAIVNNEKVEFNGSYAFKACGCDKNEDEEWVKTCHFPSPECHGESLTPSTLFITANMTATKDENGFDHDSNPVALQAGVYTVVLATYKAGVGDMNIMCGVGLVKTGDREGYVAPDTYPITSAGAIGVNGDWDNDVALTKTENTFAGTITLAAAGEFKVRFNGAWNYSLGSGALADGQYHDNDGNISKAAGSYLITVTLSAEAMADFNTNKTIVAFTIVQAL